MASNDHFTFLFVRLIVFFVSSYRVPKEMRAELKRLHADATQQSSAGW